jgi:hypothetical protein
MIPKVIDLYLGYVILMPLFAGGLHLTDFSYYLIVVPIIGMYVMQNRLIKEYYWKYHEAASGYRKSNRIRKR